MISLQLGLYFKGISVFIRELNKKTPLPQSDSKNPQRQSDPLLDENNRRTTLLFQSSLSVLFFPRSSFGYNLFIQHPNEKPTLALFASLFPRERKGLFVIRLTLAFDVMCSEYELRR